MNNARELGLWKEESFPPLYLRKSVSSFGSCFSQKNSDGGEDCAIVMNALLLDYSDDQIREILVHEVAHAICPRHHHDSHWKRVANTLGKKWNYKIERQCHDAELNAAIYKQKGVRHPYEYELYCPVCGQSWKYRRMCKAVRHPERYRCPKDKSKLLARKIPH